MSVYTFFEPDEYIINLRSNLAQGMLNLLTNKA